MEKQAGAELCQAQENLGFAKHALPSKKLRWSFAYFAQLGKNPYHKMVLTKKTLLCVKNMS